MSWLSLESIFGTSMFVTLAAFIALSVAFVVLLVRDARRFARAIWKAI